jgi:hypothetical protein
MELLRLLVDKFPHEVFEVKNGNRLFVNGEDSMVDWKTSCADFNNLTTEDFVDWVWMNCELMDSFVQMRRLGKV